MKVMIMRKQYTNPETSVSPLYLASNLLNVSADGATDMYLMYTDEQW